MIERAKGLLATDARLCDFIVMGNRKFAALGNAAEDAEANAVHLVACWNAIEAAGGDPAIVAEALNTLMNIYIIMVQMGTLSASSSGLGVGEPELLRQNVMEQASALLHRAKRLS